MPRVRIDATLIHDWNSFHRVFAVAFGFPDSYAKSMDAWIDCMAALDAPEKAMTIIHGTATDPVVLILESASAMPVEILQAILTSAALVNWRRVEAESPAILVLALDSGSSP